MTSATAQQYFAARLEMETDCADVHTTLRDDPSAIVLLDVRSTEAYTAGHVPKAISLPYEQITSEVLAGFGPDASFVTYCWGPHCNGATRGAAIIAGHGRNVKEMLGGVWGWEQEGFDLTADEDGSGR